MDECINLCMDMRIDMLEDKRTDMCIDMRAAMCMVYGLNQPSAFFSLRRLMVWLAFHAARYAFVLASLPNCVRTRSDMRMDMCADTCIDLYTRVNRLVYRHVLCCV